MKKGALIPITICFLSLSFCTFCLAGPLDGTMWMYKFESGSRHYIGFYADYQYLAYAPSDQEPTTWSRSGLPYFSKTNSDGSIKYSAIIIGSILWAVDWGTCDINAEQASYNSFGMVFFVIPFYNGKMEPYTLEATDWTPPYFHSRNENELENSSIDALFPLNH